MHTRLPHHLTYLYPHASLLHSLIPCLPSFLSFGLSLVSASLFPSLPISLCLSCPFLSSPSLSSSYSLLLPCFSSYSSLSPLSRSIPLLSYFPLLLPLLFPFYFTFKDTEKKIQPYWRKCKIVVSCKEILVVEGTVLFVFV